ncbi:MULTISPECIES: homocysteine S-methyltransferase family protein [unclassified Candidatus Paralachnospira]|uniref:homocysteine S-methyltransferase family protein n=1 Tax=unclassified Candidatus Paralachnospira TaxID=3099471 RepID=UPI003F8E44D7
MTREEFKKRTSEGILLGDGATGSNMMKAGMPKGVCTEKWICDHPQVIIDLKQAYMDAGSQVISVPTFTANRINLTRHGLQDQTREINSTLMQIGRETVREGIYLNASVTTTSRIDEDYGRLLDAYEEQISIIAEGGADYVTAATMLGLEETMAAVEACRSVCDLPICCSLTIESDGSLFYGGNIFDAVETLAEMGADAVGINCSTGPDKLESVVRNMKERVDIPVIAIPNAGMPTISDKGEAIYPMGPDEYAKYMKVLVEAGARIIGGCCGTTPEYIRKVAETCL